MWSAQAEGQKPEQAQAERGGLRKEGRKDGRMESRGDIVSRWPDLAGSCTNSTIEIEMTMNTARCANMKMFHPNTLHLDSDLLLSP